MSWKKNGTSPRLFARMSAVEKPMLEIGFGNDTLILYLHNSDITAKNYVVDGLNE